MQASPPRLLASVSPSDALQFTLDSEKPCEIVIKSLSNSRLFYRVRSTSPAAYNVTPAQGVLEPMGEVIVRVRLKISIEEVSGTPRHKFQILVNEDGQEEEQVALLAVRLIREQLPVSPSKFASALLLSDEPSSSELDRTNAKMQELNAQNLKLIKDIDKLKAEVVKIEQRNVLQKERRLGRPEVSSQYTLYHVFLCLLIGVVLARFIK